MQTIQELSLNRNILECKSLSEETKERYRKVLIETYWNVNTAGRKRINNGEKVLIETYWNVNYFCVVTFPEPVLCLNRNILECK